MAIGTLPTLQTFLNGPGICYLWLSTCPQQKSLVHNVAQREVQNATLGWSRIRSHQLFFLCKIIQKFFHLSSGFHILAIQKNIFMVMGVSMGPRPLRSFWLMLELKEAIFNQFFIKFYVFNFSFLRFVYTSKHYKSSYKCLKRRFPLKNCKKGVPKSVSEHHFCPIIKICGPLHHIFYWNVGGDPGS